MFERRGGARASTPDLDAYRLRLLPGNYALSPAYLGSTCQRAEAVPSASGVLKASQSLTSAGTLDLDVPTVRVTGRGTLEGAALPDTTATRGQLQFILGVWAFRTPNFGSADPVDYGVSLLPGRYRIVYQDDSSICSGSIGDIPCVGQVLAGCM